VQQSSSGTIRGLQVGDFASDQALGWVRSLGASLALAYFPYFEKKLCNFKFDLIFLISARCRNKGTWLFISHYTSQQAYPFQ
jgi:hypothetical protein